MISMCKKNHIKRIHIVMDSCEYKFIVKNKNRKYNSMVENRKNNTSYHSLKLKCEKKKTKTKTKN